MIPQLLPVSDNDWCEAVDLALEPDLRQLRERAELLARMVDAWLRVDPVGRGGARSGRRSQSQTLVLESAAALQRYNDARAWYWRMRVVPWAATA